MKDLTWDLSVLYKSFEDPAIAADRKRVLELCREACGLSGEGLEGTALLKHIVALENELTERFLKLAIYVATSLAADNYNKAALRMQGEITNLSTEVQRAGAALIRMVGSMDKVEELIEADEELKKMAFHLREMKTKAAHQYPEASEDIILRMQQNSGVAFSQLRDRLTGTLTANVNGEELPLPAVRGMAADPDPAVRKAAYEAELACYKKIETPMAYCLSCIKGDAVTRYEAMGYPDVLTAMLEQSRMTPQTLEAMWTAVREALPVFRRYMRTKARLLGYKEGLPFYELLAPVGKGGKSYTLDEAHETLVKVFTAINPEMGAFIDHAFENRWIDFLPREGKEGGAFCEFVPGKNRSLVLTNFMGAYDDVSTIAHELGHGWHNRCLETMPLLLCDVPMPLAETASIFNETLLSHEMLRGADEETRLSLLDSTLQNSTQVVVDILSRFIFEQGVFELRKTHIPTADELNALMLDAQEQTYGEGLDKEYRHPGLWICKSHYYSPDLHFYNFPYCFGLLFGLGVYSRYQQEGTAFLPKYNYLLSQCGNGSIAEIAAMVGIDVNSVEYWRSALNILKGQIDEFCAIAEKRIAE